MDDPHVSPDSAIGPMLSNQKKDKTCLVCGDKALGYNFNAVSCESCKAFFRRNAHKTIRGRCEGKCDVNVESRSFCKRCRLQKCVTVGMRKDMILDDSQKKIRKQKILINKLRRHGSFPPEDTYVDSETDIKQTYSEKIVSLPVESLRKQFPSLNDEDIKTLSNMKTETDQKECYNTPTRYYQPWCEIKDTIHELIADMPETEKAMLIEMDHAHENSSFLSNTSTRLKNLPSNSTEMFNIADGFVRRIIKVAKQLQYFRSIEKDDQIALLKGSVVEIMMLRSAVNFDPKTETWNLNTTSCLNSGSSNQSSPGSSSSGSLGSPAPMGLDINALRKAAMAGADFNTLRNMARGEAPPPVASPTGQAQGSNNMGYGEVPVNVNALKEASKQAPGVDLAALRNAAKSAGMDVESLRRAAMSGASFEDLSKMARAGAGAGAGAGAQSTTDNNQQPVNLSSDMLSQLGQQNNEPPQTASISSEILKFGNSETKSMFSTYSKFIRSLMSTIFGDLVILKLLIMMSLFSPDRQGVENRAVIENTQEMYARTLQLYITCRFPEEKNMFARCIMQLTDLRNVNEVHTKMLLKMHVQDIEPLLVEIFDLPQ